MMLCDLHAEFCRVCCVVQQAGVQRKGCERAGCCVRYTRSTGVTVYSRWASGWRGARSSGGAGRELSTRGDGGTRGGGGEGDTGTARGA